MKYSGYTLAMLLLLGAAQASAQSAVWTGDYYVVIGMNEKQEYAAAYGYHLKWHDIKAGPNFEGGTFADLTVAPMAARPNERLAGRYELLAVGTKGDQAYAVTGYEWVDEPRFADGMDPIDGMFAATAAAAAGSDYVVLGRAMGGDGVLPTPRDALAYGRPGDWTLTYLPFNDALTFTHLAAAPLPYFRPAEQTGEPGAVPPSYPPFELLVVGRDLDGAAVALRGYLINDELLFYGEPLPIPELMDPVAVEWTGRDYLVVGDRGDGQFGVMYGAPGRWSRADDFTLDGGKFTAVIAAPHTAPSTGLATAYELLAVGTLKTMAVSLPGHEVNGVPVFDHGCQPIPYLLGTDPEGFVPGLAVGTAGASALSAPYPNPVAARAAFTVTVAGDQPVRVAVYDALGREVALLHDGVLTAGPAHAFTFDGIALPSGTYLIRAQGADFARTRTVALAR